MKVVVIIKYDEIIVKFSIMSHMIFNTIKVQDFIISLGPLQSENAKAQIVII